MDHAADHKFGAGDERSGKLELEERGRHDPVVCVACDPGFLRPFFRERGEVDHTKERSIQGGQLFVGRPVGIGGVRAEGIAQEDLKTMSQIAGAGGILFVEPSSNEGARDDPRFLGSE